MCYISCKIIFFGIIRVIRITQYTMYRSEALPKKYDYVVMNNNYYETQETYYYKGTYLIGVAELPIHNAVLS